MKAAWKQEKHRRSPIINRTQVPSSLQISPTSQTLTQGQTETITVTAVDLAGVPYAGKSVHYTVSGANPQSGAVTLNSAGQAQIYLRRAQRRHRHDTAVRRSHRHGHANHRGYRHGFSDVPAAAADAQQQLQSPERQSQLQRHDHDHVRASSVGSGDTRSDGPDGVDLAARGSRREASQGKGMQEGPDQDQGQVPPDDNRLGQGLCQRRGRRPADADGQALEQGRRRQLKKGKTVHLTATLTYKSSLGGKPTVEVFHVTVKGKKPKSHKRGRH